MIIDMLARMRIFEMSKLHLMLNMLTFHLPANFFKMIALANCIKILFETVNVYKLC